MTKIIKPPRYNQFFLFSLGLCLRIINKIRHTLIGYTTPRPFSTTKIERSVIYCFNVVKNWERALMAYTGNLNPFRGKNIIEIGPGPDLGTGIIILALGGKSYTAIDKNKLINNTSPSFYDVLLNHLKELPGYEEAKSAVNNIPKRNFDEKFCYIYDPDFNLEKLPHKKFDILVSQAVLEHIMNISEIFQILYYKLESNAIMVNEVDQGTHTALIRNLDPLNHLRYSDVVWDSLRFDGSPNRLIMSDYKNILIHLGFKKIETKQLVVLDKEYIKKSKPNLSRRFRKYSDKDIETKSFYLLAMKE